MREDNIELQDVQSATSRSLNFDGHLDFAKVQDVIIEPFLMAKRNGSISQNGAP